MKTAIVNTNKTFMLTTHAMAAIVEQEKNLKASDVAAFLTRDKARAFRATVNAKSPAKLKAPVKDNDGLWIFPGISHGGKLEMKRK